MNTSVWHAIVAAAVGTALLAGSWMGAWLLRRPPSLPAASSEEAWERIYDEAPMPEPFSAALPSAGPSWDAVMQANPFSPQRGRPAPAPGDAAPSSNPVVVSPRFVYKGRVQMGASQRAILEEAHSRKTHFLETGQTVAGFQVLQIEENQVTLVNSAGEELVVPLVSAVPQ